MITTFKQFQKIIISSILILSLMIAGCSTGQETSSNQERGIEAQSDDLDTEVARRETESGEDETQEQVNDALTSLSADGSYISPGGRNDISIDIQVDENNIIQSAKVVEKELEGPTSKRYVDLYNEGIEEAVVGQSLESAQSPERVNGSSLTSIGFNEALEKIREERLQ